MDKEDKSKDQKVWGQGVSYDDVWYGLPLTLQELTKSINNKGN